MTFRPVTPSLQKVYKYYRPILFVSGHRVKLLTCSFLQACVSLVHMYSLKHMPQGDVEMLKSRVAIQLARETNSVIRGYGGTNSVSNASHL